MEDVISKKIIQDLAGKIVLKDFPFMLVRLERSLPKKRFHHSMRVLGEAYKMAEHFALSEQETEQVAVAALLHDCGREVATKESAEKMLALGLPMNEVEQAQPILLHAKLGVYYAHTKYDVEDATILQAISLHTTGAVGMSRVAKIVFLADMIEPARDFPDVEAIRKAAYQDLDEAMLLAYASTLKYLLKAGQLIHPDCIAGYNELCMAKKLAE